MNIYLKQQHNFALKISMQKWNDVRIGLIRTLYISKQDLILRYAAGSTFV